MFPRDQGCIFWPLPGGNNSKTGKNFVGVKWEKEKRKKNREKGNKSKKEGNYLILLPSLI